MTQVGHSLIDKFQVTGYGNRSLHEQSHGESFMTLVMERFRGNGIYLLDEPEAALSPTRQLALLARIHQLVRESSQFIIATHSPILLAWTCIQGHHAGKLDITAMDRSCGSATNCRCLGPQANWIRPRREAGCHFRIADPSLNEKEEHKPKLQACNLLSLRDI
jgi:hypothetical protein